MSTAIVLAASIVAGTALAAPRTIPVDGYPIEIVFEERNERRIEKDLYTRVQVIEGLLANAKAGAAAPSGLAASNKAWELLGRELRMFVTVSESRTGKIDPIEDSTPEMLLQFIEAAFSELGMEIDIELLKGALKLDDRARSTEELGTESGLPALPAH